MPDPTTFEGRLPDAFERYTAAVPVSVDATAYAHAIVLGTRRSRLALPRLAPRFGPVRLALVLGLLALATAAGLLFAGGLVTSEPAPLGVGGRILAWVPWGTGSGQAVLVGADGAVRASREFAGYPALRGCPRLLGSADAMAVPGFGSLSFVGFTGDPVSRVLTGYAGFERWSPDNRALAAVDVENGPATVVTFPGGDVANPVRTAYPVKGALYGSFSPDGSRLIIAVGVGTSEVALHLLEDGTDTILATIPTLDAQQTASTITWAADGSGVVAATGNADSSGLTVIGLDGSVQQLAFNGAFAPGTHLQPMTYGGGIYVIAHTDQGEVWELDIMRDSAHDTGVRLPEGVVQDARLSRTGYGVAMISGTTVRIHWFDRESQDRIVELPGVAAAFSPDGAMIVSISADTDQPGQPGAAATLWITDPWADLPAQPISTVPVAFLQPAWQAFDYCIQWLPEVQP